MKGHSGVLVGGWLLIFWTSDASSSILSVQLLPWRPCESGQQDLKLTFISFQRGKRLSNRGTLTLIILSTGGQDREVDQACLHSHRFIAIEKVVILSGDWASGRQANSPLVYLHGSILTRRGTRDWSCGALRRSIVNSRIGRHYCFSTLVEQVVPLWNVLLRHVLLKVGLLMGDVSLEALKVLALKVYLFLYPLLRGS